MRLLEGFRAFRKETSVTRRLKVGSDHLHAPPDTAQSSFIIPARCLGPALSEMYNARRCTTQIGMRDSTVALRGEIEEGKSPSRTSLLDARKLMTLSKLFPAKRVYPGPCAIGKAEMQAVRMPGLEVAKAITFDSSPSSPPSLPEGSRCLEQPFLGCAPHSFQ